MTIRVSWLDDSRTVILREFEGKWTWDEFYRSQSEASAMLASVEHRVHQIFDFSQAQSLPPNTLTHLRNAGRNMPANRGKSVVVTQNVFYQQMYRILNMVFPAVTRRVVLVETREAALEQVRTMETGS